MVNFKIEITKERVSVSNAEGGWPPDFGTTIVFFLLSGLAVYVVARCVTALDLWLYPSNWPLLFAIVLFAGTLLWAALRNLFPSGQSITCDRNTLTIGRIPHSSLSRPMEIRELSRQHGQRAAIRFSGVWWTTTRTGPSLQGRRHNEEDPCRARKPRGRTDPGRSLFARRECRARPCHAHDGRHGALPPQALWRPSLNRATTSSWPPTSPLSWQSAPCAPPGPHPAASTANLHPRSL